jgi:class 3 adenylate cyclase
MEGYLSHADAKEVYTLVDECCELGQGPGEWQEHLATGLGRLIGGYAGTFLATDRNESPAGRVFGSSVGQELGLLGRNLFAEFVGAGGQPEVPGLRGAWSGLPGTMFCASLVELSSVAALRSSPFYRSYLEPIHVHDLLTALAAPCPGVHLNLAVCRGRQDRPFTVRERSKLTALVDAIGCRFERKLWSQRQAAPRKAAESSVLMVTDMVDFTGLVRRTGDLRARALTRRHNETMRSSFAQHCGREVAHTGDGFIASFRSEQEAVDCACEIQRRFADLVVPLRTTIRVRIGIHAGPVLREEARLFGAALIAAVRICSHAGPGQVVISEQVLGRLQPERRGRARSLGAVKLKGFADHALLFEIAP